MVLTSLSVVVSYTVMECLYIMFCANTRPVPVETTDFGEISELVIVLRSFSSSLSEEGPFQAAAAWVLEVGSGLGEGDDSEPGGPPADEPPGAASPPPLVTATSTPAMTATASSATSSATSRRRRYTRARRCLAL